MFAPSFVRADELTDDYYDIANNYYKTNNYSKAIEYLDLIITISPDDTKAKALRDKIIPPVSTANEEQQTSEILSKIQTPETLQIVEIPEQNLDNVTYDSDYYNKKGMEFYCKKEYDTALEYFTKSINLNKKNIQAYNNLAMAYQMKSDNQNAIKFFKKANKINKNYTQPLVNLANLYKLSGEKEKELLYLNKAVKLNPNDYLAYYALGNYYKGEGEYPKAIENYKEVVKINPKHTQIYLSLALCFFETEEFNYTIMSLNQYREYYPESDFAYYILAKSYSAIYRYQDAKSYIQKALDINNTEEYQFELAKIDYCLEHYQSALEIIQKLLQKNENAEMFNYTGLCNYKMKNTDAAIANFNKAIELDGLRPIYYYNLAQCYKSMGDKKNYIKYVNTATKITPINYQDFIDLSYIYFDNSNPGYAINSLNNAISKYPDVKALYLAKLKIYESIGDSLHYNEVKNTINMRFNKK